MAPAITAALISLGVSVTVAIFQHVTGRWTFNYQLRRQHEQDQRKELYRLISG